MQPRRLPALAFVSLIAVGVMPAAPASAASGHIVALAPQLKPSGAGELRDKFHDALVKGLSKAGDGVMPAVEVRTRLESTPELLGCDGGVCVGRAASILGAEKIVVAEIEDVGKNYTIKIRVFDAAGHEIATGPEERCEICTQREAERATSRAGEKVMPVLLAAHAQPVATTPSHGSGKVPNTDEEEVPGGQPRVASQTVPVTPPPTTTTAATEHPVNQPPLTDVPAANPPTTTEPTKDDGGSRFPYRPVAYAAFGLAAASLAATIGFGVYAGKDGKYLNADNSTCTLANPSQNCPREYSGNTAGAAAFGVITALSAGAGAVLLYLDWKHPRARRTAFMAAPMRGGFAASASLDF